MKQLRTSFALALAIFVVGWALQFLGHKFEGMKPAFFDDAKQLLIGPLYVCAELYFLLGARPGLRRYIEERVGPTVARSDARFETFREFYPFYLSEHRNPTCRKLHFAGSTLVLALIAAALWMQAWALLWLTPQRCAALLYPSPRSHSAL